MKSCPVISNEFQSTPSVWRETLYAQPVFPAGLDFNPLPPCGGRHLYHVIVFAFDKISIHSLRVEGDTTTVRKS